MRDKPRFRSSSLLLAIVLVSLASLVSRGQTVLPEASVARTATWNSSFYPMGWFDDVRHHSRLPTMRSGGMNAVLPYNGSSAGKVRSYLDQAQRLGIKVFVEIDRIAVGTLNPLLVRSFVQRYRSHPAVFGWLLADEPTLDDDFMLLNPSIAEMLYKQIKSADPKHPVGMVFGVTEDPKPWLTSLDVLLYDDYVQDFGKREFFGLWQWRKRLDNMAALARKVDGYIPILQAFGQDAKGRPQDTKRLPTSKELRYITFSAIQHDATGIMFFARYRSRDSWIKSTLTPLTKEIAPALRAFAAGPIKGAKVVAGRSVESTLFRDPKTKALYLVVVHHVGDTTTAKVKLDPSLHVTKAATKDGSIKLTGGVLSRELGPYGAQMYRLGR